MPRIPGTTNRQSAFLRALRTHLDGPPPELWPSPAILRKWLRREPFRRALDSIRDTLTYQTDFALASAASQDGRVWDRDVYLEHEAGLQVPAGRVPGRFMLGKAFFVYWPAGHRPLTGNAPAVVPNFGEMRFID